MERVCLDVEAGRLLIADLDPLGVEACIEFAAHPAGRSAERKATIDRTHELPLGRQAGLLRLSRNSHWPIAGFSFHLTAIDALHLDYRSRAAGRLRDLGGDH
jgi:hypothetical protein